MATNSECIRILVIEDHPKLRRALCDLLACYEDMHVIGTAGNGPDGLHAAHNLSPDVVPLDVGLPVLSGIQVARQLRQTVPAVRIVMLTSHDVLYLERAMGHCAHAYLSKAQVDESLAQVIREVYGHSPR